MLVPSGSVSPNNSCRTVSPRMQTEAPARSSDSEKLRPDASAQSRTSRYLSVVPLTCVDQLELPQIACVAALELGATARTPLISFSIAMASSAENGGADERAPPPPPNP